MLSIILVLSFTSCIALIAILKKSQNGVTTANAQTTITPNDILKGEHDEILKKKFSIAKKLPQFTSNQQKTSTTLSPAVLQPTTPDLVVSTITRTPKYPRYCVTYNNGLPELCPDQNTGTKHWPNPGENLTYTATIINRGTQLQAPLTETWYVNGNIASQKSSNQTLENGASFQSTFNYPMPSSNASISFEVKSTITNETLYSNNILSIGTHDLTIGYWVEKPLYDALNSTQNMRGSYSFEDWIQEHIFALNTRLSGSKYYGGQFPPSFPSANGIPIQIRLDYIIVGEQFDGLANPFYISANYGENYYNTDGHWKTTDGYETNELYAQGFAQWYTDTYAKNLDIGLLHEIAHQLGAPDLYQTDLNYIYTDGNNGLQIKNILGEIITRFSLPGDGIMYPYAGLMAGGDARPYDSTYFSSHTATGMATTAGYRRGFYAEYLFDTPKITNVKIVDGQNQPLANKKIALYQKSYDPTSIFDNNPEIIGTTDALGNFQLPNRTTPTITTITGHTLSNNPFGQIDVVARNATMIIAITNQEQTEQGFGILTLLDLNLEYWKGNKEIANITIKTNYPKIINNTPTQIPTPTITPTRAPTFTPTPTRIPTSTPTPTRAPTSTPTPTRVATSTPTPTRTPTFTPTPTRIPTSTPTPTQIPQTNKNLLLNYGFESLDNNRYPTNWSPVRISSDKITYITGFTGNNAVKLTAYLGNWTGYTQRVIGPWTKGAQITFSGYAYSQEISTLNQNGDIQVIIYYANSQVQDLTLVPTTSKKWEYLEKRFTITQDAKSLMYRIRSPISASNNISFDELKLSIN